MNGHADTKCFSPARVTLVRPLINSEKNSPFFLPLGLLCLGSILQLEGHSVEIIDYEYLFRLDAFKVRVTSYLEDFCRPLLESAPQIIGITVLSDTLPLALLMCRYIKNNKPKIKTVLGGPGVFGLCYEKLLQQFPNCVDYLCKREGELSFLDLANKIGGGEQRPVVKGMIEIYEGQYQDFGEMEFADLDSLPPPSYNLVNLESYLSIASPRIFDLYVGAGCTFACKFCTTAPFWSRTFRAKSPSRILQEMVTLNRRLGIVRFNLLHDNFANDKRYLSEFLNFFEIHNDKYEWACAIRPDSLSREELGKMKAAGCFALFCGTDSGSSKILRSMAKASSTKKFYESFRNCKEVGISLETNTIIGYPDESDSDLEDTLSLVFDCVAFGSSSSDVSVLQPLPGAPVTENNKQYLVNVDNPLPGNFLPAEVLNMVQEDLYLFPGFGFIKKNNREFDFYSSLVKLVRYFTRHYFRTLYFLKEVCDAHYVELLSWLSDESDPEKYIHRLNEFINTFKMKDNLREVLNSILFYEHAVESLKRTDLNMELTNVYSVPSRRIQATRYILIESDYEVAEIFMKLPALDLIRLSPKKTTYLIYENDNNEIITLRLSSWQKDLWLALQDIAGGTAQIKVKDLFVKNLASNGSVSHQQASAAVSCAIALFTGINIQKRVEADI